MRDRKLNEPSEETKKKILTFFLHTSVPRILVEQKNKRLEVK